MIVAPLSRYSPAASISESFERNPLAREWSNIASRRTLFDTMDRDYANEIVGRIFRPHLLIPQKQEPLRARMTALDSNVLELCELSYGDTVEIAPGAMENFYLLQVPVSGQAEIQSGNELFVSNLHTASLLSPTPGVRMRWLSGNRQLCIRLGAEKVRRFLNTWSDHRPDRLPVFRSRIDWIEHPMLHELILTCLHRLTHIKQTHSLPQEPVVGLSGSSLLEQQLLTTLFCNVAHNSPELLNSGTPPLAPRAVRLVEDHLHHHCDHPLTPEYLAQLSGVSVRSLFLGFQRYRGISPMRLLHEIRLRRARLDLLGATPGTQVTDVALRWQLTHTGRFAQDYKQIYGETPRQTLLMALRR